MPILHTIPSELFRVASERRLVLELTEAQLEYVHSLLAVDEGENAEPLTSSELAELESQVMWHHSGIHGPKG